MTAPVSPVPPAPVKVAFIGAGPTARAHVQAFLNVPGVEIVGIFNRSRAKAEALATEFAIPHVCDSVKSLYETTQADLVVMVVSFLSIGSVLRECMTQPWTIFAEKPPGIHAQEAASLVLQAQNCKSRIYVALNRRAMSATRQVMEDLAPVDERRFIQVFGQEDSIRVAALHPPEVVSHLMYGNSIHVIDYLRIFGRGDITNIQVPGRWNPVEKTPVSAWITFSSGDIGAYVGVWDAPSPWAVSVTTASRRWEMRPLEKASVQRRGEFTLTPMEPHEWDRLYKPGFRYQAEQIVRKVQGLPGDVASLEDAALTMDLIGRIYA